MFSQMTFAQEAEGLSWGQRLLAIGSSLFSALSSASNNSEGDRLVTSVDPAMGRITTGCSAVNELELSISSIEGLVNYFNESTCSPGALQSLGSVGSSAGASDAVNLCKNLDGLRSTETCAQEAIDPSSFPQIIAGLRSDEEMKELEVTLKAEVIADEMEDMKKIVDLQASFAADIELMNHLYKLMHNEDDPNKIAHYKSLFGLEDDFFSAGNTMPLSEFVDQVMSCAPGGLDLEKFGSNSGSMCGGDVGSSSDVINQALERYSSNCGESEDCSFRGKIGGIPDLREALSSVVGDEIALNSGAEQLYAGNIAAIDPQMGMLKLPAALQMMNEFNGESVGGQPLIIREIEQTLSEANANRRHPGLAGLNASRVTALNHSLGLIRESSSFLRGNEGRLNHFNEFIESIKEEGRLGTEGLDDGTLFEKLLAFEQAHPEYDNLLVRGDGQEVNPADAELFISLVQGAAIGQRMGDYVYENYRANLESAKFLGGRTNSEVIDGYSQQLNQLLDGGRSGQLSEAQLNGALAQMGRQADFGTSFRLAASFESIFSTYDNPIAQIHGSRNMVEMLKRVNDSLTSEAMLREYPDLNNLSPMEITIKRMKLVKNGAMSLIALRSAMACKEKTKPVALKHKFCNPLSDPEYGRRALEKLLGGEIDANGGDLLSTASLYCTPILAADLERVREAQNFDPLSGTIAESRFNECRERSNDLFCDEGSCSVDQMNDVINNQVLLYGFSCQPGHQTRATAQVAESVTLNGDSTFTTDLGGVLANLSGDARTISGVDKARNPTNTGRNFDSGLQVTRLSKSVPSKSGNSNFLSSGGGTNISRAGINAQTSKTTEAPISNSLITSKDPTTNFSNTPANIIPNPAFPTSAGGERLTEELRGQENGLDPATQALLTRLEEMERRQTQLQRDLEESRKSGEGEEDPERTQLLAELQKLKSEIPLLENQLREKQDVRRALAEAPAAAPTPAQVRPVNNSRRSAAGPSRGIASVAPSSAPVNAPATGPSSAGPVDSARGEEGGSYTPSRTSRGAEISSLTSSGAGAGEGLYTSDSVLTLTSDIRDRAVIVAPGVSPEDAVLQARGPILIPLGVEGEFIMYEPELTVDGEVKTEDGQVVFKAVVKVSDSLLARDRQRAPASVPELEPTDGRDPYRIHVLDGILNTVTPTSAE